MVPKIASLEQHVEDAWEKHDTLAAKVARAAMNNQQEQQESDITPLAPPARYKHTQRQEMTLRRGDVGSGERWTMIPLDDDEKNNFDDGSDETLDVGNALNVERSDN